MATRTPRSSSVDPLPANDRYGKRSIPGAASRLTERRLKTLDQRRKTYIHKPKNGIFDPMTFYHLVDALLNIKTGTDWTSAQLAEHLNETRPFFAWDAVTVGRILNDLVDCLTEANGPEHAGIEMSRDWSGRYYQTTADVEGQVALMNLLEDLTRQCEAVVRAEAAGQRVSRLSSPLNECASVMNPLVRGAA